MSDAAMQVSTADAPLVPGRECGSCRACCVALTIAQPTFRKPQGVPCPHLCAGGGCGIYLHRPPICRTFFCGWRTNRWVRPTLRPDGSGVLVTDCSGRATATQAGQLGVLIMLLRPEGIEAEGLAETVCAPVAAGIPVWISVASPPGYVAAHLRIDDKLREAVRLRNRTKVMRTLRKEWRKLSCQDFRPSEFGEAVFFPAVPEAPPA